MKRESRDKNTTASKVRVPSPRDKLLGSEWPLLIYPVLVVAALAVLYGVNRSIQNELAPVSEPRVETPATRTQDEGANRPAIETSIPLGEVTSFEMATARNQSQRTPGADRAPALPGEGDTQWQNLQGTARVLAMLRQALKTGDNAQIKQCMDGLMAMGDDAIGPLSETIANGNDETAVWAAKALARMGTPMASSVLLDTLGLIEDGWYKEQMAKETSNIADHDSWPTLLNALQDTTDASVLRAASTALAKMADKPVVDEIVARYEAATTDEEADRLAQMLGNISSPAASESLLALAGSVSSVPQDSLEKAAVNALANVGDTSCVNYLLRKLEATPPGEGNHLYNAITSISQPQAEAALRYAAAGSKDVSAEQGRTAAIYALENFPSEQTYALLEEIVATEDNISVISAAARTLDNIRNAEPVVAANTAATVHEPILLPSNPLQK